MTRSLVGPPIILDNRGRLVRTLGAKGEGPGESIEVHAVLLTEGDSIITLDRWLQRMTVFSPDGRSVRQSILPAPAFTAAWSPSGAVVFQQVLRDRERIGKALHTLDRAGKYVRSFGIANRAFQGTWHVTATGTASVWMIPSLGPFLIEKWSITGQQISAWSVDVPWFPRDTVHRYSTRSGPDPTPYIRGMFDGPSNQLWILAGVADPNWRKGIAGWRRTEGVEVPIVEEHSKVWDTMVVVVDARTGRVLAEQRFDEHFGIARPAGVFSYSAGDDGKVTLSIYNLTLISTKRAP